MMKKSTPPLLLFFLLLGACAPERPGEVRLLLDGDHAPDVLTERKEVSNPPALGGNRFLSGWWPWKEGKTLVLSPITPKARVQIVHLERRERTLVLDLLQAAEGSKVRVQAEGRDLGAFPLTDPVEIPLPADLPLGRVSLELSFEEGSRGVLAGAVRPTLPEGKVKRWKADLIQAGASLVDLARPVSGGETLMGSFIPPTDPKPGQRFELVLEREDGSPIRRFTWTPSFWNRLRGTRSFAYRLGGVQGFVRVRLWAQGAGPAARWKELRLVGEEGERTAGTARTAGTTEKTEPPRLVILYVMDALRADTVGALGGPAGISPTYNRLAREGMLFRAHRSVAPNTLPSTKALFTGRTYASRGGWKLEPEDGTTLAEMFRAAGYRTGLFSGNVYVSPAYKTDRGFEHVAEEVQIDGLVGGAPAVINASYNDNAEKAHAAALAWLRTLRPGEKAFLYFHTIHPHNPYDPPEPFRSRFTQGIPSAIDGSTPTLTGIKAQRVKPNEADQRRLRGLYQGSFSYNDDHLGRFLAQAAAFARPEETLVTLTADHGEEIFEHGGVLHGFTLYEEMVRIPLVLWAPGRLRAGEVSARTDTLDVHATLLELCGLKPPEDHPAEGRSLLGVARGASEEREKDLRLAAASSVKGGIYSAVSGKWKVIWAPRVGIGWGLGDGAGRSRDPEYLFDLEKDPREMTNLAGQGDLAAAWLRSRLLAWIEHERQSDEEPDKSQAVDPETLNKLRALGYVN